MSGTCSFWEHVYPMFINRDITRADLMTLVRQALLETSGNYRAVLRLLRIDPGDYKRFLNFLSTHGCTVDFREFRNGEASREKTMAPAFKIPNTATQADGEGDRESKSPLREVRRSA